MPDAGGRVSVVVDRALCMGSGVCIAYAPATFAHDAETKAVLKEAPGDPADDVRAAVEACPTGALSVLDDDEGG